MRGNEDNRPVEEKGRERAWGVLVLPDAAGCEPAPLPENVGLSGRIDGADLGFHALTTIDPSIFQLKVLKISGAGGVSTSTPFCGWILEVPPQRLNYLGTISQQAQSPVAVTTQEPTDLVRLVVMIKMKPLR